MRKRPLHDHSIRELQQLLLEKKQAQQQQRLRRLKAAGRVVDIARSNAPLLPTSPVKETDNLPTKNGQPDGITWRWITNKLLLLIEIGAVVALIAILVGLWATNQELNVELAAVQQKESQAAALPTSTATPVIGVVVLPSGHQPPIEGQAPQAGEAGDIPAHLLPAVNAYVAPPIPTPGPEQARLIEIPAIGVKHTIVQGDSWEQLKKGVGQHIGSGQPGQSGNLVLSAHNDIYGEIFRDLDKLEAGDEIVVSTERQRYTYVVNDIQVVHPTEVSIMAPTQHASATLISCYPYRVNTKRIIVTADLADQEIGG